MDQTLLNAPVAQLVPTAWHASMHALIHATSDVGVNLTGLAGCMQLLVCWQAAGHLRAGVRVADHVFELHYNLALLAHRQGDLQEAMMQVS